MSRKKPPQEGDPAPPIDLTTDSGERFSLAQAAGKDVVVYFYPKASTPGCTVEACEFRDAYRDFEKLGALVVGVSPDAPSAQAKFKQKQNLPFPLLCDTDHKVADAYGVWVEKNLYGRKSMGIARTTFIIGKDGKIRKIFHKVKPQGHAAEVLAALKP